MGFPIGLTPIEVEALVKDLGSRRATALDPVLVSLHKKLLQVALEDGRGSNQVRTHAYSMLHPY